MWSTYVLDKVAGVAPMVQCSCLHVRRSSILLLISGINQNSRYHLRKSSWEKCENFHCGTMWQVPCGTTFMKPILQTYSKLSLQIGSEQYQLCGLSIYKVWKSNSFWVLRYSVLKIEKYEKYPIICMNLPCYGTFFLHN